jgi:hypothetical protein
MRSGLLRAAASFLQPAEDGPASLGEGEAAGIVVRETDGKGVMGGTVGDGDIGAELRDVLGPAGVASLALHAVSHTTHMVVNKAKGFMR